MHQHKCTDDAVDEIDMEADDKSTSRMLCYDLCIHTRVMSFKAMLHIASLNIHKFDLLASAFTESIVHSSKENQRKDTVD